MKKKLTTLLLMMATLLMLAAGCSGGKSDPIVGDWSATKIKAAGIELDLATFAEQAGMEISAEFTFTNDGKFNGTVTNGEEAKLPMTVHGKPQTTATISRSMMKQSLPH